MPVGEMQPGEIERALARIEIDLRDFRKEARDGRHDLVNQVNVLLGRIEGHEAQLRELQKHADRTDKTFAELDADVKRVTAKANFVSGVGALMGLLGGWFVSWFKH